MKNNISICSECSKCGRIFFKKSHENLYIDGYKENPSYCPECNAVESVIWRFESGKSISLEDCKKLPRVMFFDRANDNQVERRYALKLKKIIEGFERELLQDPL